MTVKLTRTKNTDIEVPVSDYTITNIRKTRGMEGEGFTGTLKRGKTTIGEVVDWGDGGGTYIRGGVLTAEAALIDTWVAAHPPLPNRYGEPLEYNWDLALGMLAEDILLGRELARKAKTHTLFLLPGESPTDAYHTLSGGPVSTESLAYLAREYPGQAIRVWTPQKGWAPAEVAL